MRGDFVLGIAFFAAVAIIPMTAIGQTTPIKLQSTASSSSENNQVIKPEVKQEKAVEDFTKSKRNFKILDLSTGNIITMSAKEFVRGAVAAEMPASYSPEALRAQAVAAYTFAIRQSMIQKENPSPELKGADFSADPNNYKVCITKSIAENFYGDNFDVLWAKVCKAADSVEGKVLTSKGLPIAAAYHAISSGKTEDAKYIWNSSLPCLSPVDSEGDIYAPGYASQEIFNKGKMLQLLTDAYPDITLQTNAELWFEIAERSPSNYVTKIKVGDKLVEGQALRMLLGLRSTCFDIKFLGGNFIFDVKGYGHGAGLSQYGADYMARQGSTYEQILAHYYPQSELTDI